MVRKLEEENSTHFFEDYRWDIYNEYVAFFIYYVV